MSWLIQDVPQQLTSHLKPDPWQLHAYCSTSHKKIGDLSGSCVSSWWILTLRAYQKHLYCACNRRTAKAQHMFDQPVVKCWSLKKWRVGGKSPVGLMFQEYVKNVLRMLIFLLKNSKWFPFLILCYIWWLRD